MQTRIAPVFGTQMTSALWVTALALMFADPSSAAPGDNSIVSLESASQRAAGESVGGVSLSGTGRYVAFVSVSGRALAVRICMLNSDDS